MLRSLLPRGVVVVETTDSVEIGAIHPAEAASVRRAVEKRRCEFATGRVCARDALAELGVLDFPLLPDADGVPMWPPGIIGSISHCGGYYGAAVARRETVIGLGVDTEDADVLGGELVQRICTSAEIARLARLPRPVSADWYKLSFSAKESVYKAYYPVSRARLDFHDVEIVIDPDAGTFAAHIVRPDAPSVGGARTFWGSYAFGEVHVFTAVVLGAGDMR